MKKTIIFLIVTLLICFTQTLSAAEKLKTIVSGDGQFFYTKPYHPIYRATSKFIPDLLYPEVLMSLTAHVKIPAKTKLSKEVSDFLDKIFRTSKNPAIRIDDWTSEVLEKCFSNIENKTLPNVAKIFEKTSATNPADVKQREAAVKALNEEFLKALKGIEKNKFGKCSRGSAPT